MTQNELLIKDKGFTLIQGGGARQPLSGKKWMIVGQIVMLLSLLVLFWTMQAMNEYKADVNIYMEKRLAQCVCAPPKAEYDQEFNWENIMKKNVVYKLTNGEDAVNGS